jgi:hypothetical protein
MSLCPFASLFLCPHYCAELTTGRAIRRNGAGLRHTGSPVGTSHLHLQFQEVRDILRDTRTREVTHRWSPWLPQVDTDAALWRFRQPSFHSRGFPPISRLQFHILVMSKSCDAECISQTAKISARISGEKLSSFKVWGLFRLLILVIRHENYRSGRLISNCTTWNASVYLGGHHFLT